MYEFEERKYTEGQVRNDSRLIQAAYEYLRAYTGDYEFLVMARDLVTLGGRLSINQIKGVLNCMRGDPEGYKLLPKTSTGRLEIVREPAMSHVSANTLSGTKEGVKPILQEVSNRRAVIHPAKQFFNGAFLVSHYGNAQYAHLLEQEKTQLVYYTELSVAGPQWKFRPFAWCGSTGHTLRVSKNPQGFEICPRCLKAFKKIRGVDFEYEQ